MSAKLKLTFAGRPVRAGASRWEMAWGWPLWMEAEDKLSMEEAKIVVSYYVFGGIDLDPSPDGWLAYEED